MTGETNYIAGFYKKFLLNNKSRLFDHIKNVDVFFRKKMRNLIFGTNRSVFQTTKGKENEGIEKWVSGKPLDHINIRATVSNMVPDNLLNSIYINTYQDERRLTLYVLVDASDAMYPNQSITEIRDPFMIKAVFSIYLQSMLLYIAAEYNIQVKILYYPAPHYTFLTTDPKRNNKNILSSIFTHHITDQTSPLGAVNYLIARRVKHSVVVLISDENAFSGFDAKESLKRISGFAMTNDFIFFPVCTDYRSILANTVFGTEVDIEGSSYFITKGTDLNKLYASINNRRIDAFERIIKSGVQICPIYPEKEDWIYDFIGFFRNRLVCK
ncbi:MAG: hypothetical protein JXJ04_20470 [Spirochaetales bacterium]|nr:hypothetical protein [Spirochaetales bacterium]